MKNFLSFSIVILLLAACTNNTNCDYYEPVNVMMEVVEINPTSGDNFEVLLRFNRSDLGSELQSLGEIRNTDIDRDYLENNNIVLGNVYMGTVTQLKSGSCKPYYVSFNFKFQE